MRIVHVSPFYYPVFGGGQTYMKEVSERLARRGHDVTVLTQNISDGFGDCGDLNRPRLPHSETINGVRVKRFFPRDWSRKYWRLRGSGLIVRTLKSDSFNTLVNGPLIPELVVEIVRSKFDVVTAQSWFLPAIPYHIRLAKIFRHFAFVGIPLFHTESSWAHLPVMPKIVRCCDAVLVGTEHERRFVQKLVPGQPNVHVAGVGVACEEFTKPEGRRIRARYGLGDHPVVGYVGKKMAHKGVGALAQAMKIVWRSNPDVRLVLAGPQAQSAREREAGDRLLGFSDEEKSRTIEISPFTDEEKSSVFDAFDIFAMPSTGESFGIVYLEAWLCSKPVIGSRIGAIQCVIREGVDGLLVNPGDAQALAAAILDLVRDPEKRRRMGQSGYQKTLARFTWDKITDKVERTYANLSGDGNVRNVVSLKRVGSTFQRVGKPD